MNREKEPGRVLIVEDDREIAKVVAMNLQDIGLIADQVHQGDLGLRSAPCDPLQSDNPGCNAPRYGWNYPLPGDPHL